MTAYVSREVGESRVLRRVTRADCADLILKVHYAERFPSVTYAFGLFRDGDLEGVVTFGTPPSSSLRVGIAGKAFAPNVLELNRLVLRHNLKNDASWLVTHALRELKKLGDFIVVSFADTAEGHTGVVYQASGFSYHGLSAKRTDWRVAGREHLHGISVADEFRGVPNRARAMRAKYGADFYLAPRSRKHRYIKIVGRVGFRVKAALALKYPKHAAPMPRMTTDNQGVFE